MANLRINEEKKRITVQIDRLTDGERKILEMYIRSGYKLVESKASGKRRINKQDILNWFDNNNDNEGKANFEKAMEKTIVNKNGKTQKAGFLKALADFRKENPKAIEEIKASIK